MPRTSFIALALAMVVSSGCATYDGYYTFATTRKVLASDAPGVTRAVGAVFLAIPDVIVSPITTLLDSGDHPPTEGHAYLSYLGFRTLLESELHVVQKTVAAVFVAIVETVWFPIAAVTDISYVLFWAPDASEPSEVSTPSTD